MTIAGADSGEQEDTAVSRLYKHISDLMEVLGQNWEGVSIDYHLGLRYATEALADKLAGLGVDSAWRILDVCCGWGGPTRYLAQRFGCRVTGVDITQRSLDLAERLTSGSPEAPLITYRWGDATNLPFDDAEFDLIWSQDALCHVQDRPKALAECARVLRPGGFLVFTDWLRTQFITDQELTAFSEAFSFPSLETMGTYGHLAADAGFEVLEAEGVGKEYVHAAEALAVGKGSPTFLQRVAARDHENIEKVIAAFGPQAHLDRLEREKMDIYFAQGKLELGRFVCRKA